MENNGFVHKLSQLLVIVITIVMLLEYSPPLREAAQRLLRKMHYLLKLMLFDIRHMADPAWKRELIGRTDTVIFLPIRQPEWWDKLEGEHAAVSDDPAPTAE